MITARMISAPKGTTAVSDCGKHVPGSREGTPTDANDTAHQLWLHLRRNSLSSKQILDAMSHEGLQQLEASDDDLKVLRGQALANKRSVGAETLREWKWGDSNTQGAAPWL
ncbi:hypothetical protein Slin15195_G022020 [Septoria linicola]|uniref:Uncharacterized protein n=1 Tax=Septoria linicola TaxID=215465 RepID=A0A9Q9AML4_9PEZI|nr:hypothetical protein Slin15195_G022020 [Septoria linicola]